MSLQNLVSKLPLWRRTAASDRRWWCNNDTVLHTQHLLNTLIVKSRGTHPTEFLSEDRLITASNQMMPQDRQF